MKRCKKVLACIMAVVIAATSASISLYAYATSTEVNVNKQLLESILNDRYWIIETLINGNISNNPYSAVNVNSTGETIMDEVLENYQNDTAFKALVDAMEIYSNGGDYLSGFTADVITTFMSWFDSNDESGASAKASDIVASVDELKYESILNEVLKTDYKSSWGDTFYEENMQLETLKQRGKILGNLSSYQTALKDVVGLHTTGSNAIIVYDPSNYVTADYEIDIKDYSGHLLSAYSADLENYLVSTIDLPGVEGNDALEKKIYATGALGIVAAYEAVLLPESDYIDSYYYDGFYDDTMSIMKGVGKTLDIANKTTDVAILFEALQSQKTTTVDTMTRIANQTTDDDLATVLNHYADLVDQEGDNLTINYDSITNYIRNNQVVTNLIAKKVTTSAPKLINSAVDKFGGAKTIVLQNSIAKALAKTAAITEITVWVANQVTGIEDTAKKIYVCKYLNKILDQVIDVTLDDLITYKNDDTEENATKVLNDLEFIKQLRLYGEKTAYGSMCDQMDSWIGIMLGGGDIRDYLDDRYQASVDLFLGCSVSPVSQKMLTLSSGDVVNIMTITMDNGKTTCEAWVKKSSGKMYSIAEADLRLLGGIDLNGATINILTADNGLYLPLIQNDTNTGTINIYCDNVAIGDITNTAALNINLMKSDATLRITDKINNSGTLNISDTVDSSNIEVFDITNSGSKVINLSNVQLDVKGSVTNNGSITGAVNICGDGSMSYENAYYTVETQMLSGTGTYSHLYFNTNTKKGVKISGTQTITNYISSGSTRLRTSENIVLTGNCQIANNHFENAVSFKDYTSTTNIIIDGAAKIYNNVTFGGATTFNDALNVTSSCTSLTLNGETTVKGDMQYAGGTIVGSDWLKLHDDLNITTSNPSISNLDFVGSIPQIVNSSSVLTVAGLNNNNTSLSGVTFNNTINVTGSLYADKNAKFVNGKNIVLTGTANISDYINTNVSANDWSCSDTATINGTLFSTGGISLADNSVLSVTTYEQSSGTLTIEEGSKLSCIANFLQAGTTTNNGIIAVDGDSKISGSFDGGTFKSKGDVTGSKTFTPVNLIFESKVAQKFSNSSTTTVKNLTITNTSKSGFSVGSIIKVSDCFVNNCTNLINGSNIVLTSDCEYFTNGESKGDIAISGNFTVAGGETITVNGKLILKSGAILVIEDDATLLVKRCITSSSATISISQGGLLQTNDYFSSSSDTLNIDGDLFVNGDAKITSSTVNATGTITFKGDLSVSSGTWNKPNVAFVGKTPQSVSGSTISVNDLTVDNSSKSGITFNSTINYYGTYTNNASVINNESKLVQKS